MFPFAPIILGGKKEVVIELWGAGGRSSGTPGNGGAGGYLKVTMKLPAGADLAIVVGEDGYRGTNSSYDGDGGGGNSGDQYMGGGGGLSGVFFDSPMVIGNSIAIAGGGGGGGYQSNGSTGGWLDIGSGLRPLQGAGAGANTGGGGGGYAGGSTEQGGSSWHHADATDITLTQGGGSARNSAGKVIITINGVEEFNQTAHSEGYTLTV